MAENIAAGNSGAQATFTQWMNSPGHNANMLGSSFTILGIGRATGGGQYGVYWTNVFGGATEPSCSWERRVAFGPLAHPPAFVAVPLLGEA
jgi:hypothetical protein